jgi:hypothetical protein
MAKKGSSPIGKLVRVTRAVKDLPRHQVASFRLPRKGFFHGLQALVAELDDIGEFIHLENVGESYILKVRHR